MSHLPDEPSPRSEGDEPRQPPPPPPGSEPAPPPPPSAPPRNGDQEGGADRFAVPFGVFDGFGLVLWSIVAQILVAIPLVAAGFEFGNGVPSLVVLMVTELIIAGGVVAWLAARNVLSPRLLGPARPRWVRDVAIGLGVGVGGFVLVTTTIVIADVLFGPLEAPSQALLETTRTGGLATVLSAVIAVVFAPIIEETIFRGVLFQALRQRFGLFVGVGLSALAFALIHLEVTQPAFSMALLLLGAWLALSFHYSRSLVVPIVGHAVFNGITVTLAILGA